jgi:DnaJ domain
MKSFYDVLGVSTEAKLEDIKKSFRTKALSVHPDKGVVRRHLKYSMKPMKHYQTKINDVTLMLDGMFIKKPTGMTMLKSKLKISSRLISHHCPINTKKSTKILF